MKYVLFILFVCVPCLESRRQKRIVLGTEAKPHSKPYQVHNVLMLNDGNVEICGGALISRKYVLTAAHCFIHLNNIVQTVVIMGAHNLKDEDKEIQVTKTYILHKEFKKFPEGHTLNDIALIKLKKPAKLSKNIQPINLPRRSQIHESFNGKTVIIAGWGKTENQDVSYVLLEGTSIINENDNNCKFPSPLICTWVKHGAPCVGDSGSPLVYNNTVIGVLSTGYCVILSYHTRVTSFLDWIEKNSDVNIID